MKSLHKRQKGFTIIELLIVIVVIGILAAIVITTYSGIQAKTRNSRRQTDIQTLQTQFEAYFSQNGYYPSLKDVNSVSWRKTNMPSLNPSDMLDPSSGASSANATLAAKPTPKEYSYQVTDSSGLPCETTDTNCAKYTLTAELEGSVDGSKIYVKQNLD